MSQRRRARIASLPNDLTTDQYADICAVFNNRCALTDAPISGGGVHIEHFIAVATGHGGTIAELCYPLRADLNLSMGARNPFEWYIENADRFDIDAVKWNALINYLAAMNGMEPLEFRSYVYDCYEYGDNMPQRYTPTTDQVDRFADEWHGSLTF